MATLNGDQNDNVIVGSGADDVIVGGPGDDVLRGGPGADRLFGGEGDDVLLIGPNDLEVDGGPGVDTVVLLLSGEDDDAVPTPSPDLASGQTAQQGTQQTTEVISATTAGEGIVATDQATVSQTADSQTTGSGLLSLPSFQGMATIQTRSTTVFSTTNITDGTTTRLEIDGRLVEVEDGQLSIDGEPVMALTAVERLVVVEGDEELGDLGLLSQSLRGDGVTTGFFSGFQTGIGGPSLAEELLDLRQGLLFDGGDLFWLG